MNNIPNPIHFYDEPTDSIWFYDDQANLRGIDQCPNCYNGQQLDGKYLKEADRQRIEAGIRLTAQNQQS